MSTVTVTPRQREAAARASIDPATHPADCTLCPTHTRPGDVHVYVSPARAARTAEVKRYLDSLVVR